MLGNYVIQDKLGEGGMGMVLKAEHQRMDRVVALKVHAPRLVRTPEALARFQREVKAAARLNHASIVLAYDADEADGTHFLVMEYVPGSDLHALVKRHGTLSVDQAGYGLHLAGGSRRSQPPWWQDWRALAAAGAAAFLLLLLDIWVIIGDKDGKEIARIQAPEGATVTQEPVSTLPSPVLDKPGAQPEPAVDKPGPR